MRNYAWPQVRYDRRKMRAHGLVERVGSRDACRLSHKRTKVALPSLPGLRQSDRKQSSMWHLELFWSKLSCETLSKCDETDKCGWIFCNLAPKRKATVSLSLSLRQSSMSLQTTRKLFQIGDGSVTVRLTTRWLQGLRPQRAAEVAPLLYYRGA